MLTKKQHELLVLIHERLQAEGVPPSFEEMKEALSLKSKSGIHRLITALEERGFIRRLPNRARALEIIRMPEGLSNPARPQPGGFRPDVIMGGKATGPSASAGARLESQENSDPAPANVTPLRRGGGIAARYGTGSEVGKPSEPVSGLNQRGKSQGGQPEIQVMGKIAAGVPIAAIQHPTHSVAVPPSMIGMGAHFALEIEGDSMIEAGILDGDTVIIKETANAENGDIVVALVDDEEATLKKFRKLDGQIALEPANRAYETRILSPDRVKVQGKLAGLVRSYQ